MVTRSDIISEVIDLYPEAINIFNEYWLWCAWCWIAFAETIEEWARAHFFEEEIIDRMIDDINEILNESNLRKNDSQLFS